MRLNHITLDRFERIVLLICDRETSYKPEKWSRDNPLSGHCAVVSLLAQYIFGGDILRASLSDISGYEYMGSHCRNVLPSVGEIDFTRSQFQNGYPRLQGEVRSRERILRSSETAWRYKLLAERLERL